MSDSNLHSIFTSLAFLTLVEAMMRVPRAGFILCEERKYPHDSNPKGTEGSTVKVSHPSPANSPLHRGKRYIRFLSIFSRLLKYLQNCNKSHSTEIKPPRPSSQFNTDFITYSVVCHQQQDETNL